MKYPDVPVPTVDIDHSIGGNAAMAFVQEGATISIHSTTPEETKCAGLFCDKQWVHKITTQSRGCGCYHMLGR
eukprot:13136376-Ditylum_brightwellii.AAC.1